MVWRRRVILTRSSRSASWAATGARGAWADGAGADGAGAVAAFSTSSFMMRPSRPVPCTCAASSPFSAISFSAEGALAMSLAPEAAAGWVGASAAGAGAAAPALPPMMASLPPAPTVEPSSARILLSVPEAGAGTSTDTLSVSSSHSISSWVTVSPGFLNHVATVASVTLSPSVGTMTSMVSSPPSEAGEAVLAGSGAAAGAVPAPSVRVASNASTPTVSPSFATISDSVPAAGEGTSTVTLSVSSSQSISSAATVSPGCLNQVATVASVTLSPSVGTRTSVLMILSFDGQRVVHERGLLGFVLAGQTRRGRSRGGATDIDRARTVFADAREHPFDVGFDEGPATLVLRLFLT